MSIFKGSRTGNGLRVNVDNTPLNLRLDLISYAPAGFDWGYDSMGSAQLALAILAHELGTGPAMSFHEAFQREVVNRFNHTEWKLDSSGIESHLADIKKAATESSAQTQAQAINAIIMESSFNAADQLFELLNTNGYQGQPEFISAVEDFAPCLQEQLWDLILVNPRIGNNALATVCKTLARMAIDIPVIALPDRPDVISVVEAMRIGAKDLVLRGDDQHLLLVIRREIDSLAARRERARLLSSPRQTEEVTPAAGSAKRRNGKDHSYVSSRRDTIDASGNQPAPAQSDRRNTTAGATGGKSDNDNHHTQTVQNQSDPKAVLAALAANRLSLVFQPIVSLENEADRIFELFPQLIAHDNHIVSSQALYATMPENMAKRLDSRIIERAGKLIIDQQIAGEHVHFFIRLSNQAVVNPTIVQQVEQLVFGNALDPQRLILEFPEAAVAGRLEQAQEMIQSLDQLGCSSALYDSGLSSNASQLIEQLDIRYVKLAGSLIADYGKQPDQLERMLKALQRAAKARNAILIASDVPDGHTLSTFWKYGIDYIQGDHIQSPQPRPEYDFA